MTKWSGDPLWARLLPTAWRHQLAGRVDFFSVAHNGAWLLSEKLIRLLFGLLVSVWVTRHLGPARYGELAYALTYIAFFQAITSLGLDGIAVRDINRRQEDAGQILGTAFALRLGVGVSCWLIAISGMAWAYGWNDPGVGLAALAGGCLIFQAADTVDLWFQSQSQNRRTVLAKLTAYLISSGLKIFLILADASLPWFAAVVSAEAIMGAFALLIAYRRFPSSQHWRFSSARGKIMLKESYPYIIGALSITIYMRIDQIMIKELLSETDLGTYAAMLPFSTLWHVLPMTLHASIAPLVARKKMESEEAYYELLLRIFRLSLASSLLISIVVAFLAEALIDTAYGPSYQKTAGILSLHIFTAVPVFLGVAQSLWILNEGKPHLSLIKTFLGALSSIAFNWLLIPKYGLTGAAASAVISYSLSAVISNIFFAPKIFRMQLGFRSA